MLVAMTASRSHWESIWQSKPFDHLSWYQHDARP
jgi:hypothetical protein